MQRPSNVFTSTWAVSFPNASCSPDSPECKTVKSQVIRWSLICEINLWPRIQFCEETGEVLASYGLRRFYELINESYFIHNFWPRFSLTCRTMRNPNFDSKAIFYGADDFTSTQWAMLRHKKHHFACRSVHRIRAATMNGVLQKDKCCISSLKGIAKTLVNQRCKLIWVR